MPSAKTENTFTLKWSVDRYSLYEKNTVFKERWMTINPVQVGSLEDTVWSIRFCPRTENDYIACIFQRIPKIAEEGEISFKYYVSILGESGLSLYATEGVVKDLFPKDFIGIDIVDTEEIPSEWLENDQLCIVCEIRRVHSTTPVGIGFVRWKDELQVLSEDMGRLLETGYLSDVRLMANDGSSFPAHLCVLFSRCHNLKSWPNKPREILAPHATGPLLKKFLSYIYTGTVPESDVTIDLFEMIVRCSTRERFYTHPRQMRTMTDHYKESVAFTWQTDDMSSVDLRRVLPVEVVGELIVELRSFQSRLVVEFSSSTLPPIHGWFQLHCTATVVRHDGRSRTRSADHVFVNAFEPWRFPDFVPLSDSGGIRMEFELTVVAGPVSTRVESTVTEFDTGSLCVRHVELLAFEMWSLYSKASCPDLWDVQLNTVGGFFRASKAILGIRSEGFRYLFSGYETRTVSFVIPQSDPNTLSSVLGYLYTGWAKIASVQEALKINTLARKMSLHGLVKKSEQYMSGYAGGTLF